MTGGGPEGGVEVTLEPETLAVAPGERGTLTVRLRNTGSAEARCHVAVLGDMAAWAWMAAPDVTVGAGVDVAVQVNVRLPPPPTPPAGPLPFSVEVRLDGQPGAIARSATLDVQPVVDVSASLGRTDGGATKVPLTVRNRGNAPAPVRLSVEGAATVEPASVMVEPGGVATAIVATRGRRGSEFTVRAETEGAETVLVAGTVVRAGRRRLPGWRVALPVGIAVVVVAGVLVSRSSGGSGTGTGTNTSLDPLAGLNAAGQDDPNCPVRGHLAADFNGMKRAGVIQPIRYSFLEVRPGGCQPVRFNPCEPVHYVTSSALAPPGGLADLDAAFARLSAATGIEFVNDGPTDEAPAANRPVVQVPRYGQRWAPILVAWDHGGAFRLAATNPGAGRAVNISGVYVSGFLILNVDAVGDATTRRPVANGFGPGATWGRVMIHELAHIVGLGHVRSTAEIMFDDVAIQRGQAAYQSGDLDGLRVLGKESGCVTVPSVFAPPPPPTPTTRR